MIGHGEEPTELTLLETKRDLAYVKVVARACTDVTFLFRPCFHLPCRGTHASERHTGA